MTNHFSLIGVDPAEVEAALHDLSQLLRQPTEFHKLKDWALRANIGSAVFAQMIAGSIVWKKLFGRPASITLHEGFDVRIEQKGKPYWDPDAHKYVTPIATFFPSTRDASQDEEHYRVNFLFFGGVVGNLQVKVAFKNPPNWTVDALSEVNRVHILLPGVRDIEKDVNQALIVEPFEVISLSHGQISPRNP